MASKKSEFKYFIISEPQYTRPGSLCYISKSKYESEHKHRKPAKLFMSFMGSLTSHLVMVDCMSCLSTEEAELLCGLERDFERLTWFQQKTALKAALDLTVDTPVTVEVNGENLQGIIRYIRPLPEKKSYDPISGTMFWIEFQGKDKAKGLPGGEKSWPRASYHCDQAEGLHVVPFSRILPVAQIRSKQFTQGDMVSYMGEQSQGLGLVLGLEEHQGETMVCIDTDNGELTVPLNCVAKEKAEDKEVPEAHAVPGEPPAGPAAPLGVNSMVELSLSDGCAYGVIRWTGSLPGREDTMCGLELEEPRGVCDGSFKGTRHFSCMPKKGLFIKLATCRPDSRFHGPSAADPSDKVAHPEVEDEDVAGYEVPCKPVDPLTTDQVDRILIGRPKGIQGHCNSCYMDAALFSLFSCSSVLDSLLFKEMKPKDIPIQNTLLRNIVNPLRSHGYVEGKHVMKLRQQLLSHGYSHTFTTDEKDPEEFLTIIMQHIMALEPLLKLSAGGKVQESYNYQIFLDQNHSLVLPTVQQLLEHSFHSAGLKLAESPSCLILQMPRFGKKFKMFDKIIPSLELDVTDLLTEGPQQCLLCGQLALIECTECFTDSIFSQTGFKLFCEPCSTQVHSHPRRQGHRPSPLQLPADFSQAGAPAIARDKLELFAVLCIETSHYVSFVKHGPKSRDWIFFDSMADREGGVDGYNIPQVQACPEVGEYLDMPPGELANQAPRDMKGVAKRLFCDAYMYLYRNGANALYC